MIERTLSYVEALVEALEGILDEEPRVTLIGAGFVGPGPARDRLSRSLERHADRVVWPPIAELAYCGAAIGAAMGGLRPIVDLSTATFSYEAIPQIVNEAAITYSNSAGQTTAPVVFHMLYGLRGAGAAQHSGSPQGWYWNAPGLQVAMPGSPADVKGLLRWAALRSGGPTVFMSHQRLFDLRDHVPDTAYDIPFGRAEIKRAGTDATVVACGVQVHRALAAADVLADRDGISVEVVDPRTLQPLDLETIVASVQRTGRLVVTDESPDNCGVAAGIAALVADAGFDYLRAPIKRVSTLPVPVPYARAMEDFITPSSDRIVAAVRSVLAVRA